MVPSSATRDASTPAPSRGRPRSKTGPAPVTSREFFRSGDLRGKILSIPGRELNEARMRNERAQARAGVRTVDTNLILGATGRIMAGLLQAELPNGISTSDRHERSVSGMTQAASGARNAAGIRRAQVNQWQFSISRPMRSSTNQSAPGRMKRRFQRVPVEPKISECEKPNTYSGMELSEFWDSVVPNKSSRIDSTAFEGVRMFDSQSVMTRVATSRI